MSRCPLMNVFINFRTCLKEIRAFLRLMRFNIGEEIYAAENTFYRELQNEMAPLRDSNVRRTTLESLMALARNSLNIRLFDRYYAILDAEYELIRKEFESGTVAKHTQLQLEEHLAGISSLSSW